MMHNASMIKFFPRRPNTLIRILGREGEDPITHPGNTTEMTLYCAHGGGMFLEISVFADSKIENPGVVVVMPFFGFSIEGKAMGDAEPDAVIKSPV